MKGRTTQQAWLSDPTSDSIVRVFRMIPGLAMIGSSPVVLEVWSRVDESRVIEYQSERLGRWMVLPIWVVLQEDPDPQTF